MGPKVTKKIIPLFIEFIVALIIMTWCPRQMQVSMPLFYVTFSMAVISCISYFRAKNKTNYLDFDTLFISVLFIISFFSTFFYNAYFYKYLFLGFAFDESYINYGSLVSLIGLQSYFIGSLICDKKRLNERQHVNVSSKKLLNVSGLSICIIIGCILFIMAGGLNYYQRIYANTEGNSSPFITHILLFVTIFSIVLTATEYYNCSVQVDYKIKKMTIFSLLLFACMLMFVGNRTTASQIVLPIVVFYAIMRRNVGKMQLFIFLIGAIALMWIFQNVRSRRSIDAQNINIAMVFTDLTIPSRATFVGLEYVDTHGYTYGRNMMGGIVGIVPFLASIINIDTVTASSAELLTEYSFDKLKVNDKFQVGLGTNVIADIFLSFGEVGVVIFMYFLGWFVCYVQRKTVRLNYYSMVVYSALVANSVFLARASYTHPLRYIVIGLLVAYLVKNMKVNAIR